MAQFTCPACNGVLVNRHAKRCRKCYDGQRAEAAVKVCSAEGCDGVVSGRGLCAMHYQRLRSGRDVSRAKFAKGLTDEPYVGSWFDNGHGYIVRNEYGPFIAGKRTVLVRQQHRLVMEQMIGRPLLSSENVHHINGQRADNRPENLELWSKSQPAGQRVADKVAWAIELLALYQPDVLAVKPVQLKM